MTKQILTCYWHCVVASFCYYWVSHDCHSNLGESCPVVILYSVRFCVSLLAFHTGLSAVPAYLLPLDITSYEVWPIFPCFSPCKHSNSTQWVVKQLLDKWIFASVGHALKDGHTAYDLLSPRALQESSEQDGASPLQFMDVVIPIILPHLLLSARAPWVKTFTRSLSDLSQLVFILLLSLGQFLPPTFSWSKSLTYFWEFLS